MEYQRELVKQKNQEIDRSNTRIRELEGILADREYELEQVKAKVDGPAVTDQLQNALACIAELEQKLTESEQRTQQPLHVKVEANQSSAPQEPEGLHDRVQGLEKAIASCNAWFDSFEREFDVKVNNTTIKNLREELDVIPHLRSQIENITGEKKALRQQVANAESIAKKQEKRAARAEEKLDKKTREVKTLEVREKRRKADM